MDTIRFAIQALRALRTARDVYHELSDALGLAEERRLPARAPARRTLAVAGLVGGGIAIGVGIGLLIAPTSGRELRQRMAERVRGPGDGSQNGRSTWQGD